ncbi:response regulator [Halomicronema hongdechloris]|nr:response regulator [Halomicronema hongdechloris]
MRILLVEDDDTVVKVLEKGFIDEHYAVDTAKDGQAGWQLVNTFDYDLIVLDVLLPKLDGIQFCQRLRDSSYQMPVLMVTALDSSNRKIAGLEAGADDYITKPFELDEILARVRVLLRRAQAPIIANLTWGDLQLNPSTRDVTYGEKILNLTPKEYRLLELFMRQQSQVFTRSVILDRLWSCEEAPGEDTVTAHIKGLRRKLTEAGAPTDLIQTVYGVGYRLKPLDTDGASDEASRTTQSSKNGKRASNHQMNGGSARPTNQPRQTRQQQTQTALRSLWYRVSAQHHDRLAIVKRAVEALASETLSPDLYQQAYQAIHSLKGALGIFGLTHGSELARAIEDLLMEQSPLSPQQQSQLWELIEALEQALVQGPQSSKALLPPSTLPLLVLIDDDPELSRQLTQAAKAQSLTVQVFKHHEHLQRFREDVTATYRDRLKTAAMESPAPQGKLPDLGIVNYSLENADETALSDLSALINQIPPLPVLVCSADDSLVNRIKAARLGQSTFLHQPDVAQILSWGTLLRSQPPSSTTSFNILMVDDDPHTLSALHALLNPWGIKLNTLEDSSSFWQILQETSPDLLILDIEMPEFNGIDLCRVVRQTPQWQHLPIVFLTAYTDTSRKHAAMLAGANDFIDKSLANSDLLTRLFYQLKRPHWQQTIATILDPQHLTPHS